MGRLVSSVCVGFSGLVFRFCFPEPLELPAAFTRLACEDPGDVHEEIQLKLLYEPLRPEGDPIEAPDYRIYPISDGQLCIYPALIAEDGCQVAFLRRRNHKNILYYPASRWDFYAHPLNCRHLIRGESLLESHGAFLLHSSVVMLHGKTVLFCGPSGMGKSTQADLWCRHLGARLINGDRCLLRQQDGIFHGGGSLWCGTSQVYRPESAPVAGIFLLEQAPENQIFPAEGEAFVQLLKLFTVNSWSTEFMEHLLDFLTRLLTCDPVYHRRCLPYRQAAALAYHTIFPEEDALCPN